jgi:hypothetical protein
MISKRFPIKVNTMKSFKIPVDAIGTQFNFNDVLGLSSLK